MAINFLSYYYFYSFTSKSTNCLLHWVFFLNIRWIINLPDPLHTGLFPSWTLDLVQHFGSHTPRYPVLKRKKNRTVERRDSNKMLHWCKLISTQKKDFIYKYNKYHHAMFIYICGYGLISLQIINVDVDVNDRGELRELRIFYVKIFLALHIVLLNCN
jgi:hypothetical protein